MSREQIDVEALRPFATARQVAYLDAYVRCGSLRAAAKDLGVAAQTVIDGVARLRSKAALQGVAPEADMTRSVPDPFVVRGVSSYYNKDGVLAGQWVKSRLDEQRLQVAIKAAVEALAADVRPALPVPMPERCAGALLNLYTLTDAHVGMRAWKPETGDNWDLTIAEQVLTKAVRYLVLASPKSAVGFVNQLGDFLHFDSLLPVTPTHGHILDGDGRYAKVIQVAVRILRYTVDLCLQQHERVVVLMAEGNHDLASSVWLRHLFGLLYENEPRVLVIQAELPYYAMQHGRVMLGFHHGHLKKNEALPLLFAAQFPEVWGGTVHRVVHTGHRHHVEEKEHNGMTVVQHPTLAARDAHAARHGYVAGRSMTAITYHAAFGQVSRTTAVPEMFAEEDGHGAA